MWSSRSDRVRFRSLFWQHESFCPLVGYIGTRPHYAADAWYICSVVVSLPQCVLRKALLLLTKAMPTRMNALFLGLATPRAHYSSPSISFNLFFLLYCSPYSVPWKTFSVCSVFRIFLYGVNISLKFSFAIPQVNS